MKPLVALILVLVTEHLPMMAADGGPAEHPANLARVVPAPNERVRKLFEAMRAGKCDASVFPALGWEDIPSLLAVAPSTAVLKNFPRNAISSQYEPECSEGMVALWLIEGLRREGKFPSLTSLCLPEGRVTGEWREASEKNHPKVLKAYGAWWQQVRSLPKDRAAAVDPLEGTRLHWH